MNTYKLRFIPIGGIVGVTKNMYVYELYKNEQLQDILLVDCGIGFPKEAEFGVDFVIPDISYLIDKVKYIRGVVLTHGHEDHIGALCYLYDGLGKPKIYASKLTAAFVANKFKEFNVRPDLVDISKMNEQKLGEFQVKFIKVTHSIPDPVHLLIKTPVGVIYHGADFKFDLTPPYGTAPDFYEITKAGHEGILCLLSDSLGAEREGLTLSESIVGQTFEDEMRKTKGKFIMTTFSSNISRIRQCVETAIKFNRKIFFLGRSMKDNTELAKTIGYLPIPHSLIGKEGELHRLPPNKICLIVAGSQGQFDSAMSKLATKQNPNTKIEPGDKVIFSSDPIPGNEDEVYNVIEELSLQGADVVYPDIHDQLHASGHGNQEDLKFLMRFTDPKYFIPIGGSIRHQKQYEKLAEELGYDKKQVFSLKEGETVWFTDRHATKGEIIETKNVYVDAYGIGDVGRVILRDRQTLSREGMVVAILSMSNQNVLIGQPKIISRGFIYYKEGEKIYQEAIKTIEKVLKPKRENVFEGENLKREICRELEELFYKETGRKPLIMVEIIQI